MQVTAGAKLFGGRGSKRLPADVHAELIAGLYTPLPSLLLGWGSSVLIGAVVSLRTGSA